MQDAYQFGVAVRLATEGNVQELQALPFLDNVLRLYTVDNGTTLAHVAAENGHAAVLRMIRDRKGRLDSPDLEGRTSAHTAAEAGTVNCLRALVLDLKCDPDVPDKTKRRPLHLACSRGNEGAMRAL